MSLVRGEKNPYWFPAEQPWKEGKKGVRPRGREGRGTGPGVPTRGVRLSDRVLS